MAADGIVLVTGGSRGIGAATATLLAGQGRRVVIVDVAPEPLAGTQVILWPAPFDVASESVVVSGIADIEAAHGPITGLVNAAGVFGKMHRIERVRMDQWDREVNIDLRGTFLVARSVGVRMAERKRGAIVNVASVAGMTSGPIHAYTAAKVIQLTQTLAAEWGRAGVRVNAVSPGFTRTVALEAGIASGALNEEMLSRPTAMNRLVEPIEVAQAIAWLLSPDSSAVTGVNLPVDAGFVAGSTWAAYGGMQREKDRIMNIEMPRKKLDLSSAIAEGDIRVLLMVLVHMTGDERWLEPPYKPRRDVRLIPDPHAGMPEEIQDEIRAAVLKLFENGEPRPVITDPGNELMLKMMRATLGENVAPEYAPLMREEMGFIPRDAHWSQRSTDEKLAQQHVLIVGAGVCAIALGVALGRLGIPYTIVEKNDELGGTWYVNRYPGCGVDTPNHSYSFSFGPRNPWTRYFAQRQELLDYLKKVALEYDIRKHLRLNTELTSSYWDESKRRWISTLKTGNGEETFESTTLVSAIGQLNDPAPAHFTGEEDFNGEVLHSALWSEGIKLDGKRVAVIGTGATAMQLVPSIADRAASVAVYQRTAQWARPVAGYSDPITEGAQWLLAHLPFYVQWYRFNMFWRYGDGLLPFLRKDPDWPHPDRAVNKGNDRHREELTDFIHSELKDRPDLIEKCVPTYPPYGKRILLDNNWFKTLTKPNVELVTDRIDHFAREGIVTADGKLRPADIIVISTGFKVTEMAARLNITGRGGKNLKQAWASDNPTAYLGLTVPDFPNLFVMLGPNSGPAHGGSVIFQSECQSRYISACLVEMIEQGIAAVDVRPEAHDQYIRQVDAEHEQLIWTHPGMTTYYRNSQGRVFSAMPWRFVDYWAMTHDPDLGQYRLTKE